MKKFFFNKNKLFKIPAAISILFCFSVSCTGADSKISGADPQETVPFFRTEKVQDEPSPDSAVIILPEGWDDGGIFKEHYEPAYKELQSLSLEQKIGQLLLVRCPSEDAAGVIKNYKPGGFVLFKRDFEGKTKSEVIQMNEGFQKEADIPMILTTDEEGGSVVRFSSNPLIAESAFESPQTLFKKGGMDAIKTDAENKATLMRELGLNVNLAPVADISTEPSDYIYNRTFGKPAGETAEYVSAVVRATQSKGIACTLKHFPGYAGNVDTHKGISMDKRPEEVFFSNDLIPFEGGINAGAHSVMVSHNIVECFDSRLPMSLSPSAHDLLRNRLNFTGIIMTDDLMMDAIKVYVESVDPTVQAVLAGNDMLIVTDYGEAFDSIKEAAEDGVIPMERIDRAVFRILAWKYELGLQ